MTEKENLWAIKVNMWLFKSSIYDLNKISNSYPETTSQECFQIGKIDESYQFKKAYTNTNQLRKINAPLAKYIYDLLFKYVEKRTRKLKGYCYTNDDSSFEIGNRKALNYETSEIVKDILKIEEVIQSRVKELEEEFSE